MKVAGLLMAAVLTAAGAARADAPDPPHSPAVRPQAPVPKMPQSIWRISERRAADHLQSGLSCPASVYAYGLNNLRVYDSFGLDVSCGYRERDRVLTIYVTRAPTRELGEAYEAAKAAIGKLSPQLHPALLSEDRPTQGVLAWRRAIYAEDGGLHTSLWMARLQDWFVEYRATYPAADEPSVTAALSKLTEIITASAGARIRLCSAAAAPPRSGVALTDQAELRKLAMMSSLVGAAAEAAANQGKTQDAKPVTWCAEEAVPQGSFPLLAWRGVHDDGGDAGVDRVTAMTIGPAPEMVVARDELTSLAEAAGPKAGAASDRWTASVRIGGQTLIFGYFDGRPPAQAVAGLFASALQGKARPIGGYSVSGQNINISAPPAAKP